MTVTTTCAVLGLATALAAGTSAATAPSRVAPDLGGQSIYQRQTSAQAVIAGSPGWYDGSFSASGTSSICGEIPKEASITGEATFVIEFPGTSQPGAVASIAFGSKQLVGGVTSTTSFRLNILVVTAKGGRPPAYALNTDPSGSKNTGTATLTQKGNVTMLKVVGMNDRNETINLTVTCR